MQKQKKRDEFMLQWQALQIETPAYVRQLAGSTIEQNVAELAELFYSTMQADEVARLFLSNDIVNTRLHASMQNWLRELFAQPCNDPQEIYQHQCKAGKAHARMSVPIRLVMRGTRLLKLAITEHLVHSALNRGQLVVAVNFVSEAIELALDTMTIEFSGCGKEHTRRRCLPHVRIWTKHAGGTRKTTRSLAAAILAKNLPQPGSGW